MLMVKPPYWKQINHSHPLARNLAGYWVLNEGIGNKVNDLSGQGNEGTINGALWTPGGDGHVLSLNGSSAYLNFGNDASVNPAEITVGLRIRGTNFGSDYRVLMAHRTTSTAGSFFMFVSITTRELGIDTYASGLKRWSSGIILSNNQWYNIHFTYDGVTRSFYIDGVLRNTNTDDNGNLNSSASNLLFGKDNIADRYYFAGLISNASIYSRALSAKEISWLHRAPYAIYPV